jgi:hypothetical protein
MKTFFLMILSGVSNILHCRFESEFGLLSQRRLVMSSYGLQRRVIRQQRTWHIRLQCRGVGPSSVGVASVLSAFCHFIETAAERDCNRLDLHLNAFIIQSKRFPGSQRGLIYRQYRHTNGA